MPKSIYLSLCLLSSKPTTQKCILSMPVHYNILCVYEMVSVMWADINWMSVQDKHLWSFRLHTITNISHILPHTQSLWCMRNTERKIDFICRNVECQFIWMQDCELLEMEKDEALRRIHISTSNRRKNALAYTAGGWIHITVSITNIQYINNTWWKIVDVIFITMSIRMQFYSMPSSDCVV